MKNFIIILLFLAIPLGFSNAATDYFLKLDGVKGETTKSASAPLELATGTSVNLSGVVGTPFVLDATRSTDDGLVRTFVWRQVSGPTRMADQSGKKLSFTPSVAGTYVFELRVTDRAGKTTTDMTAKVLISSPAKMPGVEPDEIDVASDGGTEKKGNVEFEWKVEEGESAPGVEPDDIDVADDGEPLTPDFSILLGGGSDDVNEESRSEVEGILLQGMSEEGAPAETLSLNFEKIKTTVKKSVKLFGFIPVETTATVEIDAEKNVKVKFPWWAFLASGKDEDALGKNVLNSISNVLKIKHDTIKNAISNVQ